MTRAEPGIRAPGPALTTIPTLKEVRVMADSQPTTSVVTYKTVSGFPNYMVGDDGSVWEMFEDRWVRVQPSANKFGYLTVILRWAGSRRQMAVHRLVLEVFVGPCPPGMVCRHVPDFEPSNNRLSNLKWGTEKENAADVKVHGCRHHVPKTPRKRALLKARKARLSQKAAVDLRPRDVTPEEEREIRSQAIHGFSPKTIADDHGLPLFQVMSILGIIADSWER